MERLYSSQEVADMFYCSREYISNLARTHRIESIKIASKYFFTETAINEYILESTLKRRPS